MRGKGVRSRSPRKGAGKGGGEVGRGDIIHRLHLSGDRRTAASGRNVIVRQSRPSARTDTIVLA